MRARVSRARLALLLAFALLLAGCGDSAGVSSADVAARDAVSDPNWDSSDVPYDAPAIDVVPAPVCADGQVSVLHAAAWPGRGVALLLRSEGSADDRTALLAPGVLALGAAGEADVPLSVATVEVERSYVLLLVEGGADTRAAVAGFVQALPEGTRVALYRRCGVAAQVGGFSPKRERVVELLGASWPACPADATRTWSASLAAAAAEAWAIGGPIFPARRALVVVSEASTPAAADWGQLPMGVDAYLVGPDILPSEVPAAVKAFTIDALASLGEGLLGVQTYLAQRATRLVTAAACLPAPGPATAQLRLPGGAACTVDLPEGIEEEDGLPCDAALVAAGQRAVPARVELLFTAAERATFDQVCADKVKDDFPLRVRVGDAEPVTAVAHLRGQTSLDCQRKSFTIDLARGDLRVLGPGFAAEELHLISMCKDDRYYNQVTANLIMEGLGLFPLHRELTELQVDGASWGVYELLQKPKDALLETTSRPHALVRRRFDPEDKLPDVEYPPNTTSDAPVVDAYWQLVDGLGDRTGDALVAEARSRLDLDNFLAFVAFQSLMGVGDYIDEIYFYGTESARRADPIDWYDVHAWDMDDLYTVCHHSGKFAWPDPFGLVFCAEGDLEMRLLADPVVYARYVDRLDELIATRLTESVLDQALQRAAAQLLPFFDRPGVPEAMVELVKKNPAAVDGEVAKADILAAMDTTRQEYRARRDKLIGLIEAWRAAR